MVTVFANHLVMMIMTIMMTAMMTVIMIMMIMTRNVIMMMLGWWSSWLWIMEDADSCWGGCGVRRLRAKGKFVFHFFCVWGGPFPNSVVWMMTVVMRWLIAALSVWTMAHGVHLNQPYTVLVLDKQDWRRRLLIKLLTLWLKLPKIALNYPNLSCHHASRQVSRRGHRSFWNFVNHPLQCQRSHFLPIPIPHAHSFLNNVSTTKILHTQSLYLK